MCYITLYPSVTTDQDDVKFKLIVLYSVWLSYCSLLRNVSIIWIIKAFKSNKHATVILQFWTRVKRYWLHNLQAQTALWKME